MWVFHADCDSVYRLYTHTTIYSLRRKNNDVNRTRRKNKKRDIQQTHTHTKNEDIVSPGFCHSKATNSSVACNPERKHTSEFQLKNEIQKKIKLEHSHNNAPLNGTVVFFSLHRNSTFFVFICFATAICKNCMFVLIAISCTARTHIHIHTHIHAPKHIISRVRLIKIWHEKCTFHMVHPYINTCNSSIWRAQMRLMCLEYSFGCTLFWCWNIQISIFKQLISLNRSLFVILSHLRNE